MMSRSFTVGIDSSLENAGLVGLLLQRLGEGLGLPELERYHLQLCGVEAVTNSILHAYGGREEQLIEVQAEVLADRLEVRVSDRGLPIPPDRCPPQLPEVDPEHPELLEEGGRGLFLIFTLMDRVEILREKDLNTLLMVKHLPRPTARTTARN